MKTPDFTTTLMVDQTAKKVFDAINNPALWWSGEVVGEAKKLNDEFTYRYQDFHFSKQRVVEIIPDQKIVWLVTECVINYVEDKNEWLGTRISFEISGKGHKTSLRFSHLGLTPEVDCFESCSTSWSQLIHQSLYHLITTGESIKLALV